MENKIEINKSDLRNILLALIDKLDILDNKSFLLDKDMYWNILDEELYNVYQEPKEMTIGSITEDQDFLQKILLGERDVIGYDFVKVSHILRSIGDKM
jgi:hypothetical protein